VQTTTLSERIFWYQDILCALLHIHDLEIAHSDIRAENLLVDHQGRAILSDFSAASPFGEPNLACYTYSSDLPFPINGLTNVLSDTTDRFAMGSLVFHTEVGMKPNLSVD
jgi:serine/threonine protein kinase